MQPAPTQTNPSSQLPGGLLSAVHYLSPDEIASIQEAYNLGASAHAGQLRLSGEDYISHPLEVAKIAAELGLDVVTITASILHDVLENTAVTKQAIEKLFGSEVADIVDGVSKITHISAGNREIAQAESFQKMLLAMTKDLRVILVKLADRLHNMRTLHYHNVNKRHRIAKETLEIYAPIAQRLGIDRVRRELEELGFTAIYPLRYKVLAQTVNRNIDQHSHIMDKVSTTISQRLSLANIPHEISGRRKNLYSIYQKMRRKNLSFSEVLDILALRIILENVDDCYRALGLIHNLYKPRPGHFKDYIALPKPNGYQSLHTSLFGSHGIPIEIQMRTQEMHEVSEHGIAAHTLYKTRQPEHGKIDYIRAKDWVNKLVDLRSQTGSSLDFMENLKGQGLLTDEVYVFTPDANIITLPKGATALDFAFAVHTELGLHCSAAFIDRQPVPLNCQLQSSQTVEIITAKNVCTSPVWLDFATTTKARFAIRNQLKHLHRDAAFNLGKRLLGEALEALNTRLSAIKSRQIADLVKALGLEKNTDLFVEIGLGNQMPMLMARRLLGKKNRLWRRSGGKSTTSSLTIKGADGLAVTYAKCCHPIPGDRIVGTMSPGKGLVVHRHYCRNLPNKKMHILLEWSAQSQSDIEYQTTIRVKVQDKRGMLAVIAGQIAQSKTNIENISVEAPSGNMTAITLTISVKNLQHLETVVDKIRMASKNIRVERVK